MTTTSDDLLDRVRIEPVLSKDDLKELAIETATLEMERDKLIIERDEKIAGISEHYAESIEALNEQLEANTDRMEQRQSQKGIQRQEIDFCSQP